MYRGFFVWLLVVFVTSCHHSSIELPSNGIASDLLLKKMNSRFGNTDSTEIYFYYDAQLKLILKKGKYVSPSLNQRDSVVYKWDPSGNMSAVENYTFSTWFVSRLVDQFYYLPNRLPTYKKGSWYQNGNLHHQDSTVFTFSPDSSASSIIYERYSGGAFLPTAKYEWQVVDGNVVTISMYEWNNTFNDFELKSSSNMEFDNRINPLRLKIDFALPQYEYFFNKNNVVKKTTINQGEPLQKESNTVFIYHNSGHPLKGVTTSNFGSGSEIDYYY